MGATLPTLTRHLSDHAADLSAAFGRLYAANTIGAIVGAGAGRLRPHRVARPVGDAARRRGAAPGRPGSWPRPRPRSSRAAPRRGARAAPPRPAATSVRDAGPPIAGRPRLAISLAFVSGPDLARLPGPVDPAHRVGDRQLDLRVLAHPDGLPARPRPRRAGVHRACAAACGASSTCSPRPRSRSPPWPSLGMVILINSLGGRGHGPDHLDRRPARRLRPEDGPRRPAGDVRHGPQLPGRLERSWPATTARSAAGRASCSRPTPSARSSGRSSSRSSSSRWSARPSRWVSSRSSTR